MIPETSSPATTPPIDTRALRRKVLWRIVPLVFLLYVVAYLDRANVGFAKESMKNDLHFSDDVFGWGFGIFFAGYLLLEIPGALLVEHWSARKWFTRILLTWGVCSMSMALVRTPWQFYLARFLLGVAEAGLFPGVIVYFTHWFPRADRARAMAGMVYGIPLCLAVGAQTSGLLLEVNWLGLPGWQWVFLIEGFPAVLLGFVVLFYLVDRPRDATWLTPAERDWLEQTLEGERRQATSAGAVRLGQAMRRPAVWLLAIGIFLANTGGYTLLFWLPTVVKNHLRATAPEALPVPSASVVGLLGSSPGVGSLLASSAWVAAREPPPSTVLNWMALFYLCGLPGVWLVGQSSDRSGERKWHCIAGMVFTGVFLAISVMPGQSWAWVFGWLCLTMFFAYFWPPPFWVLPTLTLSSSAAAVAIGFINICANLAGQVGNPVMGKLKFAGYSDRTCLIILAGCYVAGGLIISFLRVPRAKGALPVGPVAETSPP